MFNVTMRYEKYRIKDFYVLVLLYIFHHFFVASSCSLIIIQVFKVTCRDQIQLFVPASRAFFQRSLIDVIEGSRSPSLSLPHFAFLSFRATTNDFVPEANSITPC